MLRPAGQALENSFRHRPTLDDYEGPIRQIAITDFGHEKPTLLLTNQLRRSASSLIEFYARRMLIENTIADSVDFFHIDALSSAVALKINCDLQLTLMASSLYRLLGARIGKEYTTAHSSRLFRDFIEAQALVTITEKPSRSPSANALTAPCCWPPASRTPTSPCPGGAAENSKSRSANPILLWPRPWASRL